VDLTRLVVDVVGWLGAACLLLAYGLLAARRLRADWRYHGLNLAGALGLALNGAVHGAWPSVGLNVVWLFIGALALRHSRRVALDVGAPPPP
jgi:hypothetical protein